MNPRAALGLSDETILMSLHKMRVLVIRDEKLVDESLAWLVARNAKPNIGRYEGLSDADDRISPQSIRAEDSDTL